MTDAILKEHEDALGRAMLAYFHGEYSFEIVEREDGFITTSGGPETYFIPYEQWPQHLQEAIGYARGRVLDIGCGAGRVGLHLQEQGLSVLGIDVSPLALEVCRLRGFRNVQLASIDDIGPQMGVFDTLVLFGNNFGLLRSFDDARRLLHRFQRLTSPQARILVESNNPYHTQNRAHLAYHASNRQRGRMPGQLHIRVRFNQYCSPWFDYLIVSPDEMRAIVAGTGWQVTRTLHTPDTPVTYAAILEKNAV